MFCPSCGRQTPDAAQFCSSCGAYLTAPAPVAAAGAAIGPPAAQPIATTPVAATLSGRPYAGFWIRFLACIIDAILLQVVGLMIVFPIGFAMGFASVIGGGTAGEAVYGAGMAMGILVSLVIQWIYEAGFSSSAKQATPGKMALDLVVTDLGGGRISFARASGRHFGKYLSSFTLLIGYLIQPFTEKRQALHDLLAGTLVLRR